MSKIIFIALWSIVSLYAQDDSTIKVMKLAQKGERIVAVMCDKKKLPHVTGEIETVIKAIEDSQACSPLSKHRLKAVATYINHGNSKKEEQHLHVPSTAKCPVCGMFVSKYPKWAAMIEKEGSKYYFDGVKDMMKYYIFDGDFIYDRKSISQSVVSDYYTLEVLDAKEAWYVLDSDIYGPMGHELIPFKTEQMAHSFKEEHHGKAIVKFDEITAKMVMALDGIDYEDE